MHFHMLQVQRRSSGGPERGGTRLCGANLVCKRETRKLFQREPVS